MKRLAIAIGVVLLALVVLGWAGVACRSGKATVSLKSAEASCGSGTVTIPVGGSGTFQNPDTCEDVTATATGAPIYLPPPDDGHVHPFAGPQSMACDWGLAITVGGIETDDWHIVEYFTLQPFSNITDWQNPPGLTAHTLTSAGSVILRLNGTSSFTYPAAYFSQGIVSKVYVSVTGGTSFPRTGPATGTATDQFNGYVTSPALGGDICSGTWTLTSHSLLGDIGGHVAGGIQDGITQFFCAIGLYC